MWTLHDDNVRFVEFAFHFQLICIFNNKKKTQNYDQESQ